jgi:isoleucyl-tRNA synthetase
VKQVTSSYNANEVEEWVQNFWKTDEIYRRAKERRSSGPAFFFVDGPPYTTGYIHLGTAWNKILKDSILRYHRAQGLNIIERAGYDMHGLPIEVQVEHTLGFTSKKDIEEFGIKPFIDRCREFALTNKDIMSEQFKRLGVWLDFDNPYLTVKEDYIEAAWWTLKQAAERGMLEQGHRVVNWCPRCETAIADSEVDYWDERDPSIYVKFPLTDLKNEYLVIWTTTPWTLPANVAVAVHPEATYARVRARKGEIEEILWMAEPLVEGVLRKGRYQDYTILETMDGSRLIGWEYASPLAAAVPFQTAAPHRVVPAEFVTLENTGMVHIAPGHGWDDYILGIREGLTVFCPVDAAGRFTPEGGRFCGMPVREANAVVLEELGDHLLAQEEVVHRYGHCWRCKKPIIFRATEQWFLRASEMRDRMLEEVETVTWFPEWAGSARFHDWVKEARDWCISRQRYWGIPIPIWQCRTCRKYEVIGTIQELEERSGVKVPDPHRPFVDEITLPCSCGGVMNRVSDIFDVWFDSAVASWATLGFPRNPSAFEQHWPADFITEGQDQTRGWFYSQLGASTIAFNRSPYKSVLMHGFALDAEGRKMSKSLGNVVKPEEVMGQYGADVLRLYILSANAPWDDLKFNWEGVRTINRAINILWNVYRFPLPYMILDKYRPPVDAENTWYENWVSVHRERMPDEDRWMLSRVNSLIARVDTAMDEYELHHATRALITCVLEDLSRWYVQLVRSRMWLEEAAEEKTFAYHTIYYTMRRIVQLLSPYIPHITEQMYQNLRLPKDPESVHWLDWPKVDPQLIDQPLEEAMDAVRSFDDAAAAARQTGRRKLRWPVAECVVVSDSALVIDAITRLNAICKARANSRSVVAVQGHWDRMGIRAEPFMKAIGPSFGKDAPLMKRLIEGMDARELKKALDSAGSATIREGEKAFQITAEHVRFVEQLPEEVFSAPMKDGVVYVDVHLTPDLEAEGYAREVIRRLQEMRRQLDLRVEDFISAEVLITDPRVCGLVREGWKGAIMQEVRARSMTIGMAQEEAGPEAWEMENSWDVEGVAMTTRISRARKE